MTEKDKGIKKALQQQPVHRLPSNFTYRLMQQIEAQARLKERRMERRLRMAFLCTVALGIGGLTWLYGRNILDTLRQTSVWLPDRNAVLLYLPVMGALVLLYFFNRWLRKKYAHLLQ